MNINAHFYDIESLNNVFTIVTYDAPDNHLDVYYLIDNNTITINFQPHLHLGDITQRIWDANRNFKRGTVSFYDLSDPDIVLHKLVPYFGISDAGCNIANHPNDCKIPESMWPVCVTDKIYDPDSHPYILGYNSFNYDSVMLALLFDEYGFSNYTKNNFKPHPPTAKDMRMHNDMLFTDKYKSNMPSYLNKDTPVYDFRRSWIVSGRHIDVARLNEKQRHVGLKRLLGQLGYQILESDKLGVNNNELKTLDEFFDLIAYNASDCINLYKLFQHPYYQGQFSTKKGMLDQYPELVYTDTTKTKVRTYPFTVDTSSAQFATRTLCPSGKLTDIPTVSFLYPHKDIAEKLGIKQIDVLNDSLSFMENKFGKDSLPYKTFYENIYKYYNDIRDKNFHQTEGSNANEISSVPTRPNCICYYNKDATPSSCFVTFSTGGIHGCEYNKELYDHDVKEYKRIASFMNFIRNNMTPLELVKQKTVTDPITNEEYNASFFLKPKVEINGKTYTKSQANLSSLTPTEQENFWKPTPKQPELFVKARPTKPDDKTTKLNPKYVYTSSDPANHEDFTSYYPNLLRNMKAFYNPNLGYDRYGEIFEQKEKFGKLMKDKSIPEDKRNLYKVQREGTKLLLNSASGAADARFDNDILMNNRIISMRIIGQLFTWRIGQAQTLAGGKITSTNTDGLYCVMDKKLNDKTLAENSKKINVEIEPEPMYLISKDANNRVEFTQNLSNVLSTGGHDLSCNAGPNPTQSLDHPSVIDTALTEYLRQKHNQLDQPFDRTLATQIFDALNSNWTTLNNKHYLLTLYQTIVASSPSSFSYVFKTNSNADFQSNDLSSYKNEPYDIMQHYNRIFYVKNNDNNNAYHLYRAVNAKITPAQKNKRNKNKENPIQHDPIAREILEKNGIDLTISLDREAKINVVSNLDPTWWVLIDNSDIHSKTNDECDLIFNQLDISKYIDLLEKKYEKNWRNKRP